MLARWTPHHYTAEIGTMKTITSVALLMFVALASTSALPTPDGDQPGASLESSVPVIEGEELVPDESRWGYGGRRGYGGWGGYGGYGGYGGWGGHGGGYGRGYGGWGRGYGGWGRGYGGWGHGGWGR